MHSVQLLGVVENEKQAEAKHSHYVSRQRDQEQKEVTVIPPADTVVDPRTVMIKILQGEERQVACVRVIIMKDREKLKAVQSKHTSLFN